MEIKFFNKNLNRGHKEERRYRRWSWYREAVTEYILKHIPKKEESHLLVLGAGNCEDLDLVKLKQACGQLTLSDVDRESMLIGIKQQGVTGVAIQVLDYLGLDQKNFMDQLISQIEVGEVAEGLEEYIKSTLAEVVVFESWLNEGVIYDDIVCMPIYTQLLFTQLKESLYFYVIEGKLTENRYHQLERMILDYMPGLLRKFNQGMLKLVKPKGALIVLSDVLVDKSNGKYHQLYQKTQNFDKVLKSYTQTYGMGIGDYGLENLKENMKVDDVTWFLWPFNKMSVLIVKGISGHKNEGMKGI